MGDHTQKLETVDPERLFHTLTGIVDGLLVAHCRFAIIEVTGDRYAQALVDINGRLQVEAVSMQTSSTTAR
jgi:hypothetical protein